MRPVNQRNTSELGPILLNLNSDFRKVIIAAWKVNVKKFWQVLLDPWTLACVNTNLGAFCPMVAHLPSAKSILPYFSSLRGVAILDCDSHSQAGSTSLLSGFQLEKHFFIHTVRSYSHSTATAEFVTSIGLKKWDGFLTFSTVFVKITQEKAKYCPGQIWKCWNVRNTVDLRLLMTLQIWRWPLQIRRWQENGCNFELCEWKKVFPVGIRRGDPKYSNSYQLIPVHRQMMAVEAVKENFYCFLGIVHPTYYQSRGWGPWLVNSKHQESTNFQMCEMPHINHITRYHIIIIKYHTANI